MMEEAWRCPDTLADLARIRRARAYLWFVLGALIGGCLAWLASQPSMLR
jgi:hypothetical protein